MQKAVLAGLGLFVTIFVLCACVVAAIVVADIERYGVPAMQAQRGDSGDVGDAGTTQTPSNAPSGSPSGPASSSTQTGSDALVRKHDCQDCHGRDLHGKQLGVLYAPNVTSSGVAGQWSEAEFIAAMRTGQRPDGRRLSDAMPWRAIGQASDEELKQLWAYLQSLP